MNTTLVRWHMRSPRQLTVLLSLIVSVTVCGVAQADDKKPKPQPAVTENVSLNFTNIKVEYSTGAPGPSVSLNGVLHLVSQTLLSANGTPFAFTLHTDVSDATASSVDGAQSFVAVGAFAIPAECQPQSCPPPFWTVTFRLVPQGTALQSSLFFDLTVNTQYDASGDLTGACVAGQPDCGIIP